MTDNVNAAEARTPPGPARQRWRIVYRRTEAAADRPQRSLETAWREALEASGLPLAPTGPGSDRPKVLFGPPIPVGAIGERELIDVFLRERVGAAAVRARLAAVVPDGCELVEVYDVWVGAPALLAAVAAADYRVELAVEPAVVEPAVGVLSAAAARLLAAEALPRTRIRGHRARAYDLRPMLLGLAVRAAGPDRVALIMRLRVDPAAGAGRPDEVVRALLEVATDGPALAALRSATATWLGSGAEGGDAAEEWLRGAIDDGPMGPEPSARRGSGGLPEGGLRVVRERLVTVDEDAGTGRGPAAVGRRDPSSGDPT
jgi:radical SAM-linked protein